MEILPDWLSNTTILLDTNFLIDAYAHKKEYGKFIDNLKQKKGCFYFNCLGTQTDCFCSRA